MSAPTPAGYSRRSRLDKLGVKPAMRLAVLGLVDPSFVAELETRTTDISFTRPARETEMALLAVEDAGGLRRLAGIKSRLKRDGAVWVLWPKGQPHVKEGTVRAAALACGLVDVKVMAFDARLSALKLVIPVRDR